jgi:hypothetical protein
MAKVTDHRVTIKELQQRGVPITPGNECAWGLTLSTTFRFGV